MLRAAIYARFSSDNQSDKSIGDQIALCHELCQREGLKVVAVFDDRAISGASVINRPGYQKLMRAAEAKNFDVLVAEDMDRVFRDQGDYHHARKRLDHHGITIHTATGKVGKLDGALRALMGEMYIDNLVLHTRRGMEGVIRDGRHAGGKAYGYRPIPGRAGELEVVDDQAKIVRRIFKEYAQGYTARDIAGRLNKDNVAPPSGLRWNASTIYGNVQRGNGILLNEIYVGEIVWNKVRMVKDPTTGKRISRPNPSTQHKRVPAPHLRIINDGDLWAAVQTKRRAVTTATKPMHRVARLLSGLLRCPTCGGGMGSVGLHRGEPRVQCSTYRESGSCTNSRMVHRNKIEAAVLDGLREVLKDPDYFKVYLKAYNEERTRLARGAVNDRAKLERRAGEIKRETDRIWDAIAKLGADPASVAERLKALEAERASITEQLATSEEKKKVVSIHPAAIKNYLADIERMREALEDEKAAERTELIAPLRRLIHSVIVHAEPGVKGFEVEIKGRLQELLGAPFLTRSVGGGLVVIAVDAFIVVQEITAAIENEAVSIDFDRSWMMRRMPVNDRHACLVDEGPGQNFLLIGNVISPIGSPMD
jgi:site-specific DNA recombinase